MTYPDLPDRRMPYDVDGTVLASGRQTSGGILGYPTAPQSAALNSEAMAVTGDPFMSHEDNYCSVWLFFPELRSVTGMFIGVVVGGGGSWSLTSFSLEGSTDTTNGVDGTWETASLPSGGPVRRVAVFDDWRTQIKPLSFTEAKSAIRWQTLTGSGPSDNPAWVVAYHVFGQKDTGETPDDIIFTSVGGTEFAFDLNYGTVALGGTTDTLTFKIKNTAATLTANDIDLTIDRGDDFTISDDNVAFGASLNIASLAPGASSGTLYARVTTPAIGSPLGPFVGRIRVHVDNWS